MIVWRAPVPSKVFHAFEVPEAANGSGSRGRRRGQPYKSLCGAAELRGVSKKFRQPEKLESCAECAALRNG